MKNIKQTLFKLEQSVEEKFSNFIKDGKEFSFVETAEFEFETGATEDEKVKELRCNGFMELLPTIEVRNSFTGNVKDYYVLSASNSAIAVFEVTNDEKMELVRFSDIASINDKIILLDAMEEIK